MKYFEGELHRIAKLLGCPHKELVNACEQAPANTLCYITFELITPLGQSVLRVDYGYYNAITKDKIEQIKYNVSYLGVQKVAHD